MGTKRPGLIAHPPRPNAENVMNLKKTLVACTVLSAVLMSSAAFAQKQPAGAQKNKPAEGAGAQAAPAAAAPAPAPGIPPHVDFSASARACSEVSNFLSQPKFTDAIARAKSDKQTGKEAAKDPSAYLAKNGVMVPGDCKIHINNTGGGPSEELKITVTIRCCPLEIIITINL
jgi:hypothetical protein